MKYFISYVERCSKDKDYFYNQIISIHPLQWQIENAITVEFTAFRYNTLLNWQSITDEEYELYSDKFENI